MRRDSFHIAITTGEPAGIGPEISMRAAQEFVLTHPDVYLHVLGDPELCEPYRPPGDDSHILYQPIHLGSKNHPGQLNPENVPYVLNILDCAIAGCLDHTYDAMVTAPLQKSVINQAGIAFTGHTEYLAKQCGVDKVVMMLCGEVRGFAGIADPSTMRVALVTTHLPVAMISAQIQKEVILQTLVILHESFQTYFGISQPRIQVSGLNPHAGENGYLGREEIDAIIPAIEHAQNLGIVVTGPYPADTMFRLQALDQIDVFLAMYHDQGLIPLKMACFGTGVNITLGLPIIRSSVDHGTALGIAGKNIADHRSMLQAIEYAYQMAKHATSGS
jgi:4-hydroxythreonine-4-phosphate dehydrogenase